jgi:hypothetical protein
MPTTMPTPAFVIRPEQVTKVADKLAAAEASDLGPGFNYPAHLEMTHNGRTYYFRRRMVLREPDGEFGGYRYVSQQIRVSGTPGTTCLILDICND